MSRQLLQYFLFCLFLWQSNVLGAPGTKRGADEVDLSKGKRPKKDIKTIKVNGQSYEIEGEEAWDNFATLKNIWGMWDDIDQEIDVDAHIGQESPDMLNCLSMVLHYTVSNKLPGSLNEIEDWATSFDIWRCANYIEHRRLMDTISSKLSPKFMKELHFSEAIPGAQLYPVNMDTIKRHVIYHALKSRGILKVGQYLEQNHLDIYQKLFNDAATENTIKERVTEELLRIWDDPRPGNAIPELASEFLREKFQVDFDKDFFEKIGGHTIQKLQRENRVVQNTNDSNWVFKSLITYNTQIKGVLSWEDLLKYGNALISRIDANMELKEGWSALMLASYKGHLEVARLLIEKGANFCLLYTSPSPRDLSTSRMPSSA